MAETGNNNTNGSGLEAVYRNYTGLFEQECLAAKARSQLQETAKRCIEDAAKAGRGKEVAGEIYWLMDAVSAEAIASGLGIKAHDVAKFVGPYAAPYECTGCGAIIEIVVGTRSDMTILYHKRRATPHYCPTCAAKEAEHTRQWVAVRKVEQRQRLERLAELQTMPYQDYLQTEEWNRTRRQALRRSGRRCQLCNGDGELHVHHRTYEHRGCEEPQDLIVLCANCHAKFHGKELIA